MNLYFHLYVFLRMLSHRFKAHVEKVRENSRMEAAMSFLRNDCGDCVMKILSEETDTSMADFIFPACGRLWIRKENQMILDDQHNLHFLFGN